MVHCEMRCDGEVGLVCRMLRKRTPRHADDRCVARPRAARPDGVSSGRNQVPRADGGRDRATCVSKPVQARRRTDEASRGRLRRAPQRSRVTTFRTCKVIPRFTGPLPTSSATGRHELRLGIAATGCGSPTLDPITAPLAVTRYT